MYIPACLGKCRCLDLHLTPSYGVNSYNQIVMFTHGLGWYLCPNSLTVLYTALHSVFSLECPDQLCRHKIQAFLAHFMKIKLCPYRSLDRALETQAKLECSDQREHGRSNYKSLQDANVTLNSYLFTPNFRALIVLSFTRIITPYKIPNTPDVKCQSSALSCVFQLMGLSVLPLKSMIADSMKCLLLHISDIAQSRKYILT